MSTPSKRAHTVGTIILSVGDSLADKETTVQDIPLPAVVTDRFVTSDPSFAVRPTHAIGGEDMSKSTEMVAVTSQPSRAHHPGVIPRGAAVLRTSGSSESALTCAQTEQIANVGPLVQLGSRKYDDDDPTQVLAFLAEYKIEKFDSGASRCMSGDPNRIVNSRPLSRPVRITGFNGMRSTPTSMGVNVDGKDEYYVEDMPTHLTLLCANAYCTDGCAVLFEDGGLVLKMTKAELAALKDF